MAAFNNLGQRAVFDLQDQVVHSLVSGMKQLGDQLVQLVSQYQDLVRNKSGLTGVNENLAGMMRSAVIERYSTEVLAKQAVPSYRLGDRYATDLLVALESPSMAQGSARGIGFIDQGLLDRTARHWYRLNFGASPAVGSVAAPRPTVRFGAGASFPIGFTDAPSPAFSVPGGRAHFGWFAAPQGRNAKGQFSGEFNTGGPAPFYPGLPFTGAGSKGQFTVVRQKVSTRGIAARRFLDAGLVALAENFGPEYRNYLEDITRKAAANKTNVNIEGRA